VGLAGGSCFDFNKFHEHLFVVGTEEGAIQLYSKAYNSQLIRNFEGHHMPVYAVRWNTFHPGVFLSCSADWTVKLWEMNTVSAVMVFDLNTSVSDVVWAPYSSTVFTAVTIDGKMRLYDLDVNKHEPIGERPRASQSQTRGGVKSTSTRLAYNPKEPIILVGDSAGPITSYKLTSNLHKMSAPRLEDINPDAERARLDSKLIIPEKAGGSGAGSGLAALAMGDRPTLGMLGGAIRLPPLPSLAGASSTGGLGDTKEIKTAPPGVGTPLPPTGGAGAAGSSASMSLSLSSTLSVPGGGGAGGSSPTKSPRRAP